MSKTSCEILFENNNTNRVFYGGDTIKGSVIITLHKEKIIKGMRVSVLFAIMYFILTLLLDSLVEVLKKLAKLSYEHRNLYHFVHLIWCCSVY